MTGVVLFAHGSRDAEWSAPFERLARALRERHPAARVVIAYLDIQSPTLDDAIAALVADGATEVVVAPLFIAPGGHVRRDLPRLAAGLRVRYPGVTLRVLSTIGESEPLLEAIASWIAGEMR